jgi:hypothetical protein
MRKDQFAVGVRIDGKDLGIWDQLTGGAIDSDELTYKPGAMGAVVSLGGSVTVANVIVVRMFDLDRDMAIIHWLIGRVGKGKVTISKKSLDTNGAVYGKPLTYTAILKTVTPPEHDSMASDPALLSMECVPLGTVT